MSRRMSVFLVGLLCLMLTACDGNQPAEQAVTSGSPTAAASPSNFSSFYVVQRSTEQQAAGASQTTLSGYVDLANGRAQFTLDADGRRYEQIVVGEDLYIGDGSSWAKQTGNGRAILESFDLVQRSALSKTDADTQPNLGTQVLDGVACSGYGEKADNGATGKIETERWLAEDRLPRRIVFKTTSGSFTNDRQLDISRINQPVSITAPIIP